MGGRENAWELILNFCHKSCNQLIKFPLSTRFTISDPLQNFFEFFSKFPLFISCQATEQSFLSQILIFIDYKS